MSKKKLPMRGGFTLIELMAATVLAIIVILGMSLILADSQRGWNRMYSRIYSKVVTDSYAAKGAFDAVVRKASKEKYLLDAAGNWIEVYYYADAASTSADRYARFYCVGEPRGTLYVEYGRLNPRQTLRIDVICDNVSSCDFKTSGTSVQMLLTLDRL